MGYFRGKGDRSIPRRTFLRSTGATAAGAAVGVRASSGSYPEQHKFAIYSEEKWWHHKPDVPKVLPGCEEVNRSCIYLPLFYEDLPEVTEQYVHAFEKVWAHRQKVAEV